MNARFLFSGFPPEKILCPCRFLQGVELRAQEESVAEASFGRYDPASYDHDREIDRVAGAKCGIQRANCDKKRWFLLRLTGGWVIMLL